MNLSTLQIYDFLHEHEDTKDVFSDCIPCDAIPAPHRYPCAFVVNTEPSGMKGKHWIAIYVVSPTVAEYFDTSGRKPEGLIKQYLGRFITVRDNDVPIQSPVTDVCGAHCIYFVVERCKGLTFDEIVESLDTCTEADLMVCCYFFGIYQT